MSTREGLQDHTGSAQRQQDMADGPLLLWTTERSQWASRRLEEALAVICCWAFLEKAADPKDHFVVDLCQAVHLGLCRQSH